MTDDNYKPLDRRPIKARSTNWAAKVTTWLVQRNITPNTISVAGMVFALIAGFALLATSTAGTAGAQRLLWLVAALGIQLRLLCNLLDGMVAVEANIASPLGELFNEIPDRISDAAVLIGLGYAVGGEPVLGWFAACLALLTAYIRSMAVVAGAPNDFRGPMAKPHRMFVATVAAVLMLLFASPSIVSIALWIIVVGSVITCVRRTLAAAKALNKDV